LDLGDGTLARIDKSVSGGDKYARWERKIDLLVVGILFHYREKRSPARPDQDFLNRR
jgi:hypothetical protein